MGERASNTDGGTGHLVKYTALGYLKSVGFKPRTSF